MAVRSVLGEQSPSGEQVAGVKLPGQGDGVPLPQLHTPCVDVFKELVPAFAIHSQGGADVVAGSFGLVDVVQTHVFLSSLVFGTQRFWKAQTGSQPSGARHAAPSGPTCSSRLLWETHRGTRSLVRAISSWATRRKWV